MCVYIYIYNIYLSLYSKPYCNYAGPYIRHVIRCEGGRDEVLVSLLAGFMDSTLNLKHRDPPGGGWQGEIGVGGGGGLNTSNADLIRPI